MRSKVGVADVDIRRLDRNSHLAALVDVLHHAIGVAGDGSKQRRHEFDRMVSLQIGSVISQQGVGRRVRLVESVAGKLRHEIENLLDFFRREAALRRSLHKTLALRRHFLGLFLAHGTAQQISFSQGVARKFVGRLHHLFLIDEDAERLLQNFFQLRQLHIRFCAGRVCAQ